MTEPTNAFTAAKGTDTSPFLPENDAITKTTNEPQSSASTTTSSAPHSHDTSSTPPAQTLTNPTNTIHIELTHSPLSAPAAITYTRSPTSGANVFFLGTTRSYFLDPSRPVSRLSYSAYIPLALRTLLHIATTTQETHTLEKIYIAHRLGEVAVAEESIIVAVSAAHRGAAWRGAEELLEKTKERAEIWKREWFVDGGETVGQDGQMGLEVGVWRDNRESDAMGRREGGGGGGGAG